MNYTNKRQVYLYHYHQKSYRFYRVIQHIKMKNKIRAITNTLFLLATLATNFLANSLPIGWINTGELSDLYPNLFVPAWFTFSIWGVIYLLLIWFIIRQLIDTWRKNSLWIVEKIGPWFVVSCLANIWWIFARHYTQVALSVYFMLIILISLIIISWKVKTGEKRWSWKNKIFSQVPFGVYLGWISVATIANITAYLVHIGRNMWGMTDIFWTVVVIIVATLLGIQQLYKYANIPFVLVILRAFYGIATKRIAIDPVYASNIIWTLGLCSVVLAGTLWWKWKARIKN